VFDHGQLRAELYDFFEDASYQTGDDEDPLKPFDPSRRKVDDLVDALRSLVHIPIDTAVPSWLRHAMARGPGLPNGHADELVACSNGLVHVPTRTLYPHTPSYYAHHAVPFEFAPDAPPPARWFGFLGDLWGKDAETIQTLQEVFGYLLSGDTRQQKMFLVVGPRRSGKGTMARVLTAMLGHHHVAGPTLAGLGTNFGLSPLIGKPVAIVSDARLGSGDATSVVTERLLSISGEDTLTVDRKYREPWTGQLPSRLVILSNELPRLTDSSGALASRFIILIMTRTFYGKENPDLTRELCTELPAIFNWSLDGLERLRERGRFQQPAASEDAVREMEDLGSPIGAFVRDCCVVGPAHAIACDDLYRHWCVWCEDNGRHKTSTQVFGRDLRAVLPGLKVEQPRLGEHRFRRYSGISIRVNNNSDARVPPRANGADDALARDGTRATPMYSHTGTGTCAQCGENIAMNGSDGGYTAINSGEYLHNRCVDSWTKDNPR
jgi:putative DNA primase/helicase